MTPHDDPARKAGHEFGYRILGPATAFLALGAIAFGLAALFTGGLG